MSKRKNQTNRVRLQRLRPLRHVLVASAGEEGVLHQNRAPRHRLKTEGFTLNPTHKRTTNNKLHLLSVCSDLTDKHQASL